MKKLLVVVDMVNGFINEGALADKNIDKITPNVEYLINSAIKNNIDIIAFKDSHSYGDEEFNVFPVHCLKGTSESDFIPQIKKYEDKMIIIEKNTTNGFNTEIFKKVAKLKQYDKVFVVGCCTDICVQNFVESYIDYLNKTNKNTKIVVVEDACWTFDNENHNAKIEHKNSINYMKKLGAEIIDIKNNKKENIK